MTTYEFQRTWQVAAQPHRVAQVLADLEHYPQWWPQVRTVAEIDDDTARVVCCSTLPYTLDLVLHAVRRDPGHLEVAIGGDLEGWSRFELSPGSRAGSTRIDYTQQVVVNRRLLRLASRVLGPVARWNHEQMMRGCETGLRARLSRP